MTRQLVVSKTDQQGRVTEVREINEHGSEPKEKDFKHLNPFTQADAFKEKWYPWHYTDKRLKTFPVVQDGEVEIGEKEKLARIALSALYLEGAESIAADVKKNVLAAFDEIRNAHAQKYGFSLQQVRDAMLFMAKWCKNPTDEMVITVIDKYTKPTFTIGQLVECEVLEDGKMARIVK